MRIKNYEDVYSEPSFIDSKTLHDIEGCGKSYNWIIANHYSLLSYLFENDISESNMFNTYVLCKAYVPDDPENQHLIKRVIKNNQTSYCCFETTFNYGSVQQEISFITDELFLVNLLYLNKFIFSLNKSKIFNTRLYESCSNPNSSNNSFKDFSKNKVPINNEITNLIRSGIRCKSSVFLFVECDSDGKNVPWYIPLENDECLNEANALREYSKYFDRNKEKTVYNAYNSRDIKEILKKRKILNKNKVKTVDNDLKDIIKEIDSGNDS